MKKFFSIVITDSYRENGFHKTLQIITDHLLADNIMKFIILKFIQKRSLKISILKNF